MEYTAKEVADLIKGKIIGDENVKINNLAKIENGKKGDLCFLSNLRYKNYISKSSASIIIVNDSFKTNQHISSTLIKVKDAYSAFSEFLEIYNKAKYQKTGISKNAHISKNAQIGNNVLIQDFTYISEGAIIEDNVKIYSNCYIGENVEIKEGSILFSGVKIYHDCKIGKKNIIHSNAVIGSDGFGFAPNKENMYSKIQQIGTVIMHDNVEVGSNTSIDRATMGSTIINEGVKLDNLIQIAHNVEIGSHTVIAAQAGIAGSTKIGSKCMIGGQTAISGHLIIADKVKIAGQSGVASSILEEGKIVQGPMAFEIKDFQRSYVIFKKLPKIYKTISKLKDKFKNA